MLARGVRAESRAEETPALADALAWTLVPSRAREPLLCAAGYGQKYHVSELYQLLRLQVFAYFQSPRLLNGWSEFPFTVFQ